MAVGAPINPAVLKWARERAGLSPQQLGERLGKSVKPEKVADWESGECKPTIPQAEKLARALRVPFSYLLLDEPPRELDALPVADFRSIGDRERANVSLELRDSIELTIRKVEWMKEFRIQEGDVPLPFVGKFKVADDIMPAVDFIADVLGIGAARQASKSPKELRDEIAARLERIGVLVFRANSVAMNSHRPLSVEEFRGYTIVDEYAPAIFINTADFESAQVFSLIHEFVHILTGTSGISNELIEGSKGLAEASLHLQLERFCNRVAAETLLPSAFVRENWTRLDLSVKPLATQFRVSHTMVARTARELGLVSDKEYWKFVDLCNQHARDAKRREDAERKNKEKKKGGPSRHVLSRFCNGYLFTSVVVNAARAGKVMYRDAGKMLNISPSGLDKFDDFIVAKRR